MKNKASFCFVMLCIVIFTISCTNDSTSSSTIDNQNQIVIDESKKAIPALEVNPVSIAAPSPQNSILAGPNKLLDPSTLGIPYDLSLSIETDFIRRTAQARCELFNDCLAHKSMLWPPPALPSGFYLYLFINDTDAYGMDPLKIQKTDENHIIFFDAEPSPITVSIPLISSIESDYDIRLEKAIKDWTSENIVEYTFYLYDEAKSIHEMPSRTPIKINMTIPNNEFTVISTTAYEFGDRMALQYIDYDLDVEIKHITADYIELEFTTLTPLNGERLSIAFLNDLWETKPAAYEMLDDIVQWTYPEKIDLVENEFRSFRFKTTRSTQDIMLNDSSFWNVEMMLDNSKISSAIKQDYESTINLQFDTDNFSTQNTNIALTCDAEPYNVGTDEIIDLVNAGPDEIDISGNSAFFLTADILKKHYSFISMDSLFPQENLKLYDIWFNYKNNYGVVHEPKEERDLVLIHSFDDFIPLECELPPLQMCLNSHPHIIYGTEAMYGDEIVVYLDGHFITDFTADSMGNWGPYYLTHGCEGQEIAFSVNGELSDITQNLAYYGTPPDLATGFILEPY
ncbi:MAG: hypothetical protein ACJ0KD_00850 [Dehalococcoidia bacterium]